MGSITLSFAGMLTKAQVKDIRLLVQHKYRSERGAFLVEGDKMAREWLSAGGQIELIVALEEWLQQHEPLVRRHAEAQVIPVQPNELERVSALQTPNQALLVASLPKPPASLPTAAWCLVLDGIQDPGNLGTIIRIADWFGISHVVASPDCADFYNPKVVQSAMGGHLRVQLHTTALLPFLKQVTIPILAAALEGENIYSADRPEAAVLLIGNESKGLSAPVLAQATRRLTIPRLGGAESLNAAVSAGIICALLKTQ